MAALSDDRPRPRLRRRRGRAPLATLIAGGLSLLACSAQGQSSRPAKDTRKAPLPEPAPGEQVAIFAGGCFWCMEKPFDVIEGVRSTTSGYIGGQEKDPSYKDVAYGRTGHTEALYVVFDPKKVSYPRLVEVFWHNIDPTARDRQFCDSGTQYRSGIFYRGSAQQKVALETKAKVAAQLGQAVVTEVTAAGDFWPAENYHQDFYKKNPGHYSRYRRGCGRDRRLRALWGDAAGH